MEKKSCGIDHSTAIKDTVRRLHTVQIADLLFVLAIKCKYYRVEEAVTARCPWHIKLEFIGAPCERGGIEIRDDIG